MNQLFNNLCKLNGSIQFIVYDENNKIINRFEKNNQVYVQGVQAYRQILGFMDNSKQPQAKSTDDDYQINLQSNANDFLSRSGTVPFIQPITIIDKKDIKLQCAFRYKNQYGDSGKFIQSDGSVTSSVGNAHDINYIYNPQSFVKNSDNNITTIKMDESILSKNIGGSKWMYVYNIPQQYQDYLQSNSSQSSSLSNSYQQENVNLNDYHTGLCVDIKGPQYQSFFMQIIYDFQGNVNTSINGDTREYNFDFTDIPQPIFPLQNGKPINRQFANNQGGAISNEAVHTYYFDMFPRYSKIPKKVIFMFDHCDPENNLIFNANNSSESSFDITDIQIEKMQFFKHTLPKVGPVAIYFEGQETNNLYNKNRCYVKINKTTIKDNSICYFASLGYKQGNGFTFNKIGLANSIQNFKLVEDQKTNFAYNNNKQQIITNTNPKTTGKYFYKLQKAQPNDCNNILTCADTNNWQFIKTEKNRIDIIYKMNISFGETNE